MEIIPLILLSSTLCVTSAGDVKASHFKMQGNISCSATENIVNVATRVRCAAKCNSKTDNFCIGTAYSEGKCDLCLACPKSASPVWLAINSTYTRQAIDFTPDLLEDLFVHIPMDTIVANGSTHLTPAVGTNARVLGTPGPYVTSGRIGSSIFIENAVQGSNMMELGTHESDCFGRISNCPDGTTLAIWFRAPMQSTGWPSLMRSMSMSILLHKTSGVLKLLTLVNNGTHLHTTDGYPIVTYDEWHLIGIVYSKSYGIEVYYDGCKQTNINEQISPQAPSIMAVEIGCASGGNCFTGQYDDLRFWITRKTAQFMLRFWTM